MGAADDPARHMRSGRLAAVATEPARVLVLDPLDVGALAELTRRYSVTVRQGTAAAELPVLVRHAHVLVIRSGVRITASVIAAAEELRVIARAGTGTDNIDIDAARRANVTVFTVPGASAGAVAELALSLMLALARKVALADRQLRAGIRAKADLVGVELAGKTLGVVGVGAIGGRVAALGKALGMEVLGVVQDPAARGTDRRRDDILLADLRTVLSRSDVLCLAVPLTPRTTHLIGPAELRLMKPSALLVNVARARVVDEVALESALRTGALAGAALDVGGHEHAHSPLAALDTVVLTPHIGAMTVEAQQRVGRMVVAGVRAALTGGEVANRVC